MPANLTTLPHFSVSSAMNFANSPDVIDSSSAPRSAAENVQFMVKGLKKVCRDWRLDFKNGKLGNEAAA
jgi:hypothetical protein